MDAPKILMSNVVAELPRSANNPRNSEGDFATLRNGWILFAYSRYQGENNNDDASCNIAGMISRDGGKSFEPLDHLLASASEHGVVNVMSVSLHRLATGELCLFYLCKIGPQSAVYLRRACDDETHFGPAELCVPKMRGIYYVVNNSRICMLPSGELLLPLARHEIVDGHGVYYGSVQIFSADPDGRNWRARSRVLQMPYGKRISRTGLQEPGLVLQADGTLYCYARTDQHCQFECVSRDEGVHFSTPLPSAFTSPDSPLLIRQNPYSGIYYALWNPIPNYNGRLYDQTRWVHAGRTPFVLAQSEDGKQFSRYTIVEDDPGRGYCYPALHFLNAQEFLLSYCCGNEEDDMCLTRTRIRHIALG